jgi:hypothetical protein
MFQWGVKIFAASGGKKHSLSIGVKDLPGGNSGRKWLMGGSCDDVVSQCSIAPHDFTVGDTYYSTAMMKIN